MCSLNFLVKWLNVFMQKNQQRDKRLLKQLKEMLLLQKRMTVLLMLSLFVLAHKRPRGICRNLANPGR